MRITCNTDGLTDAWVEFSDRGWTLAEMRSFDAMNGEETISAIVRKATGCNLPIEGDEVVTDPAQITNAIDRLDLRLVGFLGSVLYEAAAAVRALGFFSGRPSSRPSGPTATS